MYPKEPATRELKLKVSISRIAGEAERSTLAYRLALPPMVEKKKPAASEGEESEGEERRCCEKKKEQRRAESSLALNI